MSELGSRGYDQDNLTKAIGVFLKEREGLFASKHPKWRRFEKLAFGASRTIDLPPHVVRHKYTDAKTGLIEEIEPSDVESALRQNPPRPRE